MKISEVKVGEQYAAADSPSEHRRGVLPHHIRQVEVVEIANVEESHYTTFGGRQIRNVRRVRVKFLDESNNNRWRYPRTIAMAAKDSVLTVEARQLVATWKVAYPHVKQFREMQEFKATETERIESALKAAGFDTDEWVRVLVSDGPRGITVEFSGDTVEALLKRLAS